MKVIICGGAGYVGSRLVSHLLEKNHTIRIIDLLWFGNNLTTDVEILKKDVLECTVENFKGFDVLVNLTGMSNDPMANKFPSLNFIFNIGIPSYLSYLAKMAGIKKFIHASTCSVYGFSKDPINNMCKEDSSVLPEFPYGISKLQSEKAILAFADDNFNVIITRKGTVCGYSPRMRFDLVINAMFKSAHTKSKICVHDPHVYRPILSIVDAVTAYTYLIENHNDTNVFNLVSKNYSISELAIVIKSFFTSIGKNIDIEVQNKKDLRSYVASCEKIQKEIHGFPFEDAGYQLKPGHFVNSTGYLRMIF